MCGLAALEQEPGQHTRCDVDHRVEDNCGLQTRFSGAHGNEHTQGRERHQGVDNATAPFKQTEQATLLFVIAQATNSLEQRRPVDAVGADRQQAEDNHQTAERREGCQVQAQRTGAQQAERNQFAGIEAVSEQATDHEQTGGNDGVGAEQ
ncbi:hypothetical protein D3C77_576440 [compost metagenome]